MPNIKKRLNEIVEDIEKNIKNKDDLEYIKSQIYNISLLFLDELDKVVETHLGRLNVLLEREKRLTRRVENMEIVQIVRSTKMNTSELSTFLKTYKNSKVLPPITYKQEENSND